MKKDILVHSCFSIDKGESLPPHRKPKRRKGQPKYQGPICRCRKTVDLEPSSPEWPWINKETAQDLVEVGLAQWIDNTQIGLTGRVNKTPRGPTIEKAHMETAYVSNEVREIVEMVQHGWINESKYINNYVSPEEAQEERARIEEYGILTLLARVKVGKYYASIKEEHPVRHEDGGKQDDWGRPGLYTFGDDRTRGGH